MDRWTALFLFAALAAGQEPLFRTGARLVTVDVAVHNNQGPIRGLTKDDFTLQDKGKAQTISVFAVTDAASPAAKQDALPPGVVSNRINSGGESFQSATVILFDRLNIPSPPAPADPHGQDVEARLKEALTPMQQQDMRVRTGVTGAALQTIARHLAG